MLDMRRFDAAVSRHWAKWPIAAGGIFIAFVLGWWITFIRPGQQVESAKQKAEAQVELANQTLQKAKSSVGEMGWFEETYTQEPNRLLKEADQFLQNGPESVQVRLEQAKSGGWKARREQYRKAEQAAKSAFNSAQEAKNLADAAQRLKANAFGSLQSLSTSLASSDKDFSPLEGRIDSETKRYPSHYGSDARERRSQISTRLQALAGIKEKASAFLPSESAAKKGNPSSAMSVLTPALTECRNVGDSISALIETLNTTNQQYTDADNKVVEGERKVGQVRGELAKRKSQTGLWLKSAGALFASAETNSRSARTLLTAVTIGETVPDRPLAYRNAAEALAKCATVVEEADREIAFSKSISNDIATLDRELGGVAGLVAGYDALFKTLRNNHAESVWSSHASIKSECGYRQIEDARKQLREARRLAGLDVQEFTQANQLVQSQLTQVRNYANRAKEFGQLVVQLEGLRQTYPSEARSAKSVIDGERSQVNSYGSHNSSAKQSFNSAESSYSSAERYARDKYFAEAIRYAKLAAEQARGTGAKCKRSYDDDQESSSSSSWDWGSGSSSSGGSSGWGGGSDSSWGGSSSSSDSSYGGSSDSSFGGSSDSDW